ncbi:unnamed protein product [Peniophora sp. CBMAI 1063]|nr:unnamed protein product [Peniophora sp. CBMAI 1063]
MVFVTSVSTPQWSEGLAQFDDEELLAMMQGTNEASAALKTTIYKDSESIPDQLRALYDSREPLGTNIELWNLMNAVCTTITADSDAPRDDCRKEAILHLTGKPVFELLSDIVVSGELFEEWPGWIRCDSCEMVHAIYLGATSERVCQAPHMLRSSLLDLLESVTELTQIQSGNSPEYARLCFLSWYYDVDGVDPEYSRGVDHMFNTAVDILAAAPSADGRKENITTFTQTHVQVDYNHTQICRRLHATMIHSKTLNRHSCRLPDLITHLLPMTTGSFSLIIETGLLQAMFNCLDLPFDEKKILPDMSPTHLGYSLLSRVCLKGIATVTNALVTFDELPFNHGAKVAMEECDLPSILSQIIRFSIFYSSSPGHEQETLRQALAISDTITLLSSSATIDKKSTIHSVFQRSLAREWYPVLMLLRKSKDPVICGFHVLVSWEKLGIAMGLAENAERKRFEKRTGRCCSLLVCRFYTAEPPSAPRTCAGCGEVQYHSKPCQAEDWKYGGHKARCKRIK